MESGTIRTLTDWIVHLLSCERFGKHAAVASLAARLWAVLFEPQPARRCVTLVDPRKPFVDRRVDTEWTARVSRALS